MKKLSKNDILALKQADHVVISGLLLPDRQNNAQIICAKQKVNEILSWEVTVASSCVFLHDDLTETNLKCHYIIFNSFVNWHWQTCVGSIMPGDEVELLWMPDAETTLELLKKNIHVDLLKMIIYRQNFRYHYLIGLSAGSSDRLLTGLTKKVQASWLTSTIATATKNLDRL